MIAEAEKKQKGSDTFFLSRMARSATGPTLKTRDLRRTFLYPSLNLRTRKDRQEKE